MKEKEKMAAAYAAKRAEEEEQSKKLGGKLQNMLFKLCDDETPNEYSLSGVELGGPRVRILVQQIAYNKSLKNLHLSRLEIKDDDGVDVAKILYNNSTLRKLELEGNNLGPKTAKELAKGLKYNMTLQFLDLESNALMGEGEDVSGLPDLLKALEGNTCLLSLNLANNKLENAIGGQIRRMLDRNHTIIDLEIGFNNFTLEDTYAIQNSLIRNKAMYDAERLKEWRERKLMKNEDERLHALYLKEQSKHEEKRMENETRELREAQIDAKFKKYLQDSAVEKEMVIQQLVELAEIRGSKGKKKKRGGGGKKKKK